MMSRLTPLVALPLLTAACASDVVYPTLAPRPVETLLGKAPVVTTAPIVTDAALDAQAAARLDDAEAGARAFRAALSTARAAAAQPGAQTIGSEAWLTAQQALTALGSARAPVGSALADLDAARIAAAAQDRTVDTARLDGAYARVATLAEEQESAYQAIAARLPTG